MRALGLTFPSFLSLSASDLLVAFAVPTALCLILVRFLEIAWFFEIAVW